MVQPKETNFVDQRELEYELFNTHGVCAIRRTFADLATSATLSDDSSKRLIVDGQDVAVVYYRAGSVIQQQSLSLCFSSFGIPSRRFQCC